LGIKGKRVLDKRGDSATHRIFVLIVTHQSVLSGEIWFCLQLTIFGIEIQVFEKIPEEKPLFHFQRGFLARKSIIAQTCLPRPLRR
jgi:hypothetical protein